MRFAIALLAVIAIAATVGTVVQQGQPYNNYVNQFGPFWAELFAKLALYTVYSAWWFLLILGFLVVSVSLCVARNTPKIIADLRSHKEGIREQALQAFHHKLQTTLAEPHETARERIVGLLASAGWKPKVDQRPHGVMIAGRKGGLNKIGYIAAHSAVVLICVGGLSDGDLIVRAQMALQGKEIYSGSGMVGDVPEKYRLGPGTPSFRGSIGIPEGMRGGTATLFMPAGVVLQELPFDIELKKFIVEYYATGMPKLFASDIVIHDRDTGRQLPATVKVNQPVIHRGVAIYQSSFDDGGSALKLRAWPMAGAGAPFEMDGKVGTSTTLKGGSESFTLEFSGLRVINVENLGGNEQPSASGTDVRKVDLVGSLESHLGSGAKSRSGRKLQNIGPSISYKLRDAAGQAREFNNYMLPVELEGHRVFLAGVRDTLQDGFRYLRIPADENGKVEGWMRLRAALLDPAARDEAARRYAARDAERGKPETIEQLRITALRTLELFAGSAAAGKGPVGNGPVDADAESRRGGLQALGQFIESSVPEDQRTRMSDVLLRVLNGSLYELLNVSRERAAPPPTGAAAAQTQEFLTLSLLSLSDSFSYPAPVFLELTDFSQVQESVFQVARAPGQKLVYLGAMVLIVGVFAMLYVRERRLWVWLREEGDGTTALSAALSSQRRTLDADEEFERLKAALAAKEAAA